MALEATQVMEKWLLKFARDVNFEEVIQGRKFRHPQTQNQVQFKSLPEDEQARLRAMWSQKSKDEEETAEKGSETKGPWTQRVREKVESLVDTATRGGQVLKELIKNPEYRTEFKQKLVEKKDDFISKLKQEGRETKDMVATVGKLLKGEEVSDEEKKAAKEQLGDVGRLAVLSILALPLGPFDDIIFFITTAGIKAAFPEFSWTPSAWREALDKGNIEDQIARRIYEGIISVLENPKEQQVLDALDALEASKSKGR